MHLFQPNLLFIYRDLPLIPFVRFRIRNWKNCQIKITQEMSEISYGSTTVIATKSN